MKRIILRILSVTCVGLLAFGVAGCGGGGDEELTPDFIRKGPLTFYLKVDGGLFTAHDAWHFVLEANGNCILTLLRFPHSDIREMTLTGEQTDALREALIKERYFELPEEIGKKTTDKGFRGIRMTVGGFIHSIELAEYDCDAMSPEELDELRRVLRIWKLVRGWFDAPSLVSFADKDVACFGDEFSP